MADRPDGQAAEQLGAEIVRPRFLAWLDIVGDPVRATTWPFDLTPEGTGDPDLDGQAFKALDPELVNVGSVRVRAGGTDTVTATLSGLILPDNDLLNTLGNRANWRGRDARLWQGVANAGWAPRGAIWSYYTGKLVNLQIVAREGEQVIEVSIESYLAVYAPASNRTYLHRFDPEDRAAEASIAVANGGNGAALAGGASASVGGGGGGGGGGSLGGYLYEQARQL